MQINLTVMKTLKVFYFIALLGATIMFIYIRYNYSPGASLFLLIPFILAVMILFTITILIWIKEKSFVNIKVEWLTFGIVILLLAALAKFL